jgi:hypothetical protein
MFLKASKLEMEWNGEEWKILWRFEGSNGVPREREKEWDDFVMFLSDQVTKPPYYAKTSW